MNIHRKSLCLHIAAPFCFPHRTKLQFDFEAFVSRHAEELLEFDKLKEIVSGFTTCAPGRRAILSLAPQQDVTALNSEFALIREARIFRGLTFEYLPHTIDGFHQ